MRSEACLICLTYTPLIFVLLLYFSVSSSSFFSKLPIILSWCASKPDLPLVRKRTLPRITNHQYITTYHMKRRYQQTTTTKASRSQFWLQPTIIFCYLFISYIFFSYSYSYSYSLFIIINLFFLLFRLQIPLLYLALFSHFFPSYRYLSLSPSSGPDKTLISLSFSRSFRFLFLFQITSIKTTNNSNHFFADTTC